MSAKSVSLLIFMVAGTYAIPLDRSSDDYINKIDQGRQPQLENVEQDLAPISSDATTQNFEGSSTTKPGFLAWFLTPLTQNLQLSPQSFLQNRIVQLKDTLNNLGVQVGNQKAGKQLTNGNGLLQVAGASDSGFYTNRLEPAGFFGGNGWLANKGGILGGPGAILSTGSILTDYPTSYRKRK